MITLYHIAQLTGGLVVSTDNLSEYWMGFWTICGDVCDYYPILNVLKGSEIYDIASYIGVPEEILCAEPADGLGISSTDAQQIGAKYPVVDRIMIALLNQGFKLNGSLEQLDHLPRIKGIDPIVIKQIAQRALANEFKRRGPIVLTRKDLGLPSLAVIDQD